MVVGYVVIAWMAYLIMVTKTTAPKIWDPYNILDISRVKGIPMRGQPIFNAVLVLQRETNQEEVQGPFEEISSRQSIS